MFGYPYGSPRPTKEFIKEMRATERASKPAKAAHMTALPKHARAIDAGPSELYLLDDGVTYGRLPSKEHTARIVAEWRTEHGHA